MRISTLCALFLVLVQAALAQTLQVPATSGPVTIDGKLDESAWQNAAVLPLGNCDLGEPFPAGGEVRLMVSGWWLCLAARLPESGRVVARSTGRNPAWWREDLLAWSFRFRPERDRNRSLVLTVNPLGGYRIDYSGATEEETRALGMAAASIGQGEWTVEGAMRIPGLAATGLVSVERTRAPRPDAPELRWHWPAANERAEYMLAHDEGRSSPVFPEPLADRSTPAAKQQPAAGVFEGGLASVRSHVWPPEEHKNLNIAGMVEKEQKARAMSAALAERSEWQNIRNVEDWERFRDKRLAALRASFGPFPDRTPLHPVVTRRAGYGEGFVLENIVFESRPGLLVTANLYLPDRIAVRIPAILLVHSHHAPKTQSELQDMGMTWARAGAAVLVPDQLGAGERLQSQPWPRESYYSRYALGMQLHLAGESLMKWMVWDLMRSIDLLLERPYIDPSRVIVIGAVAGGGDPAAVLAALDPRVAAVIPFNFGEAGPEEHYLEGPRGYEYDTAWPGWGSWETTRNLRRSIGDQFFPWFLCASVAPRGFVYSFEIAWPNGVEQQPAWARYKRVFELYAKRDRLDQVDGFGPFPGPGECTNVGVNLRKKIHPILERWFGMPPPVEYHNPRSEADLMCLTPKVAAERRPRAAGEIARAMAEERLAAARSALAALSPGERIAELRARFAAKLGDIEPRAQARAQTVRSERFPGFAVEAIAIETDPGIQVPLLLLKPGTVRAPLVVAFAQEGKERFLADRRAELGALLGAGIAVCLADVRGVGETAWTSARGPSAMSPAVTELMLGGTMLGKRLKDARAVLRYLASRSDLEARRVAFWGDSFAETNPRELLLDQSLLQQPGPRPLHQAEPLGALLSLLTALYEENVSVVAARGGLVSYLSALSDRFTYVPQDTIVPGILEAADIADVIAALVPRPVRIERAVDGRSRPLTMSELRRELAIALAAYRGAPSNLVLEEESSPAYLAAWLKKGSA